MIPIDEIIDKRIGDVRTDGFDISFGELISLYESQEFEIRPEFQRFYRWEVEQRSRLIESVLLELPIPQVFVVENAKGILELIDGLQRISSITQFIQPLLLEAPNNTPLRLSGCDLVTELNGLTFSDLPVSLRMRVKRAKVRTIVIKRQSTPMLRYEMFKRLNTGGAALSEQEVRNCTARMVGDRGSDFYKFLMDCAEFSSFINTTATLPESVKEKRGDEELVLRFFALKNAGDLFKGSVVEWLDGYMEGIILDKRSFDYKKERSDFERLFRTLDHVMGEGAFVRHRGLKLLVGRRNAIAHGRDTPVKDHVELCEYHDYVLEIMDKVAEAVDVALASCAYFEPPIKHAHTSKLAQLIWSQSGGHHVTNWFQAEQKLSQGDRA